MASLVCLQHVETNVKATGFRVRLSLSNYCLQRTSTYYRPRRKHMSKWTPIIVLDQVAGAQDQVAEVQPLDQVAGVQVVDQMAVAQVLDQVAGLHVLDQVAGVLVLYQMAETKVVNKVAGVQVAVNQVAGTQVVDHC